MCVYVWPGISRLAVLLHNERSYLVDLANQLEQRVLREVFQSKLSLTGVAGVCLPQHCMSVTRDYLIKQR